MLRTIMRTNIVHDGAGELTYEIRQIIEVGEKLASFGIPLHWENIGDPIAKGDAVPAWIRGIVAKEVASENGSYGYSPTKGLPETRQFIADVRKKESGIVLDPEDILFTNGLGDAISVVYTYLNKNARVIGPDPAYPTHSSAEGAHASARHLAYNLRPKRNWLPDVADLRNKIAYNPAVAGILVINPDNPTGMVYPRPVLEGIVALAREFDLFLVSDEIYANIVYGTTPMTPIYELVGDDVPAIVMRGLSKEVPWPGARCGWIEVYNKNADPTFARYAQTLVDAKQLEVCSTTLPQKVLPAILNHPRYRQYLKEKENLYRRRADTAYDILKNVPGIIAPKPEGAFYYTVVFEDGALRDAQTLSVGNEKARSYIEHIVDGAPPDKRFVYYLMASGGVCVVPLSGFNSDLHGFRMTLLEQDDAVFEKSVKTVAEKIRDYLAS